jgi:hypothetical protein
VVVSKTLLSNKLLRGLVNITVAALGENMKVSLLCAAILSVITISNVFGQARPAGEIAGVTTGSMWSEAGTVSPLEKGNVIFETGAQQKVDVFDFTLFSLTPYVAGGATFDTKGYDWNNQFVGSVGVQLNAVLPHGVVSVGTAYGYQDRFKSHLTAGAPEYFVQDWFGWQLPAGEKRYPGSTWATYGATAPIEGSNRVLYGFVQQGVVAGHFFGHADFPVVLFGEMTFARDTKRFDWNNFVRPGAGLKIVMPHGLEVGASFIHEERHISNTQANGVALFLKVDTDWFLLGTRR